MITLYSYPGLFGVADNNPYGLKVYAFLKLAGLPFVVRLRRFLRLRAFLVVRADDC